MVTKSADVIIIGGGVIGTSIAYYLAKQGIKATLLESKDICSGTSGACDKAISLQSKNPGLHLELALQSAAIYHTLGEELSCELEYKQCGGMIAIENESQLTIMEDFVRRQKKFGLTVDLVSIEEARKRQPALSPNLIAATYSSVDAEVSPLKATFAFARAAQRQGACLHSGVEVRSIMVKDGKVEGVITNKGVYKTNLVINAAGVYAPFIGQMVGIHIPIKPRRGQIIITEPMPPFIQGHLWSARYIVAKYNPELIRQEDSEAADLGVGLAAGQTHDGTLLFGGTREFVGYDVKTTPEAFAAILRHAVNIVPALRQVHVIRTFAGLRPYTVDGMPILGPVDGLEGFLMAAGHEGDGIALAPITGQMIAGYIVSGIETKEIQALRLSRLTSVNC
ncbi:MAG: Dimethylglycine dehydrogenase [Firmicutes bacterium]|nr:Dimethylglycine dehydrogenase [Bacillota bacterium]